MMAEFEDKVAKGFFVRGKEKAEEEDEMKQKGDDFDFAFDFSSLPPSPVSPELVFIDWKTKQNFAVISSDEVAESETGKTLIENVNVRRSRRGTKPLMELMKAEREPAFSTSSSSHFDELETLAAGSYCVWEAKKTAGNKGVNGKSNGSSKRWGLRDFLRRGSGQLQESSGVKSKKEMKRQWSLSF
ncbi:hypothetical protein QQ045_021426 [Rhodiola kirilowii]